MPRLGPAPGSRESNWAKGLSPLWPHHYLLRPRHPLYAARPLVTAARDVAAGLRQTMTLAGHWGQRQRKPHRMDPAQPAHTGLLCTRDGPHNCCSWASRARRLSCTGLPVGAYARNVSPTGVPKSECHGSWELSARCNLVSLRRTVWCGGLRSSGLSMT